MRQTRTPIAFLLGLATGVTVAKVCSSRLDRAPSPVRVERDARGLNHLLQLVVERLKKKHDVVQVPVMPGDSGSDRLQRIKEQVSAIRISAAHRDARLRSRILDASAYDVRAGEGCRECADEFGEVGHDDASPTCRCGDSSVGETPVGAGRAAAPAPTGGSAA